MNPREIKRWKRAGFVDPKFYSRSSIFMTKSDAFEGNQTKFFKAQLVEIFRCFNYFLFFHRNNLSRSWWSDKSCVPCFRNFRYKSWSLHRENEICINNVINFKKTTASRPIKKTSSTNSNSTRDFDFLYLFFFFYVDT